MGDKSPKAKNKNAKQHTSDKSQKAAVALEKTKKAPAEAKKK